MFPFFPNGFPLFFAIFAPGDATGAAGRHLHRHLGFFEPVDFVRFTRGLANAQWAWPHFFGTADPTIQKTCEKTTFTNETIAICNIKLLYHLSQEPENCFFFVFKTFYSCITCCISTKSIVKKNSKVFAPAQRQVSRRAREPCLAQVGQGVPESAASRCRPFWRYQTCQKPKVAG